MKNLFLLQLFILYEFFSFFLFLIQILFKLTVEELFEIWDEMVVDEAFSIATILIFPIFFDLRLLNLWLNFFLNFLSDYRWYRLIILQLSLLISNINRHHTLNPSSSRNCHCVRFWSH